MESLGPDVPKVSESKEMNIMDPNTLEYYDLNAEARRLQAFNRDMEKAERLDIAIQSAFNEHPVSRYVKGLPVQSPVYPAIEYLRPAGSEGTADHGDPDDAPQEGADPHVQESPVPGHHEYIHWCMPAHDLDRPSRKGCGFVRSKSGGLVYTACPSDHLHHCKGKRIHCWSLRCPDCMNDTALKKSISVERQLLTYSALIRKRGGDAGPIGHWVISPPQDLAKSMMQTRDHFDGLCRHVDDQMMLHGGTAGTTVFHPWRQTDEGWDLSPHFHILCYGRIDTTAFRKHNPGWIIKKVHSRERIRSIRHTVAYLMTHMGLGMAEMDPDGVDWDLDVLDMLIPGLKSKDADYSEKDREGEQLGKGRMVGDLSDVDWTQWTMDRLSTDLRIRHWGGVSRNSIRTIGFHRRYRVRLCKECGEMLRTYDGTDDQSGSIVRYIQDCPVMVFAGDRDRVLSAYLRYKTDLKDERLNILDFALMIPLAVSTLELGLPDNGDLIMDGPFDEPDEKFLQRQQAAYGPVVVT